MQAGFWGFGGQGREGVKGVLRDNPELADEIEQKIIATLQNG